MDYVIKGGTVCLGEEHFQSDITLRDGKIWSIGRAFIAAVKKSSMRMGCMSAPAASIRTPTWICSSHLSIGLVTTFTAGVWRQPAAGRRPSSTIWPLPLKAVH